VEHVIAPVSTAVVVGIILVLVVRGLRNHHRSPR
jgi:hypothetical protein